MPPHYLPTEATLDEVLFVLGEPLCEEEVWAILLASSIALVKYFDKAGMFISVLHSVLLTYCETEKSIWLHLLQLVYYPF